MADGKSEKEVMQIAKNLCKERGINFDDALKQFNQMAKQFGMK